jgi:uncharacterized membrane protein YhaH (DUF805 family)
MDILLTLLPVAVIGGLFFLWTAMLVHAIRNKVPGRLLWIALLILTNFIGALVYYLVIYRKIAKKEDHQLSKRITIAGSIIIVVVALATSFTTPSKNSSSSLREISLSKVIDYNLKGEIKRIELTGDELIITKKGDRKPTLRSHKPSGTTLHDHGISPEEIEVVIH